MGSILALLVWVGKPMFLKNNYYKINLDSALTDKIL